MPPLAYAHTISTPHLPHAFACLSGGNGIMHALIVCMCLTISAAAVAAASNSGGMPPDLEGPFLRRHPS